MSSKKKERALGQWHQINQSLLLYKLIGIGGVLVCLLLSIVVLKQLNQDPIVVIQKGEKRAYEVGSRKNFAISDDDVKKFVTKYTNSRYNWTEFNPKKILGNLRCITTKGFRKKLEKLLGNEKHKNEKGKKIEQYVSFIRPHLKDEKAYAKFDRIIRINEIPIVIPSEIALTVIEDVRTKCNPLGLYVNGVIEYEDK